MVALLFPDPVGWRGRSGRVIPHDLVVLGPLTDEVNSVEAGREQLWPLVFDDYQRLWELPEPPPAKG